jgi:hypothetical protein
MPSERSARYAKVVPNVVVATITFPMRLSHKNKKNVTIYDVAALTGVSYQTVSRVINRMPEVAPATRARVQQVLAEVDFRPSVTARQLASKRSTTLGLVTCATSFYGSSQILANSEQASKDLGLSFMFTGVVEQSAQYPPSSGRTLLPSDLWHPSSICLGKWTCAISRMSVETYHW